MNKRGMFILFMTVLWFGFCIRWMCCWVNTSCCEQDIEKVTAALPGATVKRPPLQFSEADPKPITSESFGAFKAELVAKRTKGNILKITGLYTKDEPNKSTHENLGLARAHFSQNLFLDKIPTTQIQIDSEIHPATLTNADFFEALRFVWIDQPVPEQYSE